MNNKKRGTLSAPNARNYAQDYLDLGAAWVRDMVFKGSGRERQPCVPMPITSDDRGRLYRSGTIKSTTGFTPPRQAWFKPLVVKLTRNMYDDEAPVVGMELTWAASVTGTLFREDGRPVATGGTLYVEWDDKIENIVAALKVRDQEAIAAAAPQGARVAE